MHSSKAQIATALTPIMKAQGYAKQGLTWRRQTIDTILVFHVEKSRWGANDYTINLGIYLRSLGDERAPRVNRCQVQASLEKLMPNASECRQVCDFEYPSFTTEERLERLSGYVAKIALPWLESHATINSLRQLAQIDYNKLLPLIQILRVTYDYLRGTA